MNGRWRPNAPMASNAVRRVADIPSTMRKPPTCSNACPRAAGLLDHIIPDPPARHARSSTHAAPVDNWSNDDWVRRQQDQDNQQQNLNTQQMINNQQMQNDQQQQQIVNDMNR
jgi:hypothetical protein